MFDHLPQSFRYRVCRVFDCCPFDGLLGLIQSARKKECKRQI